ncbi:hypothetical protein ASPZODRAFT_55785 [Penicilliopsis zonata CBS 506.65]|uniref:Plasma membrane stress response protein n=1 Tax=Penicilliopsis zonata CBS 506.65 TaxID=1073090 RepID=A0A1L9SUB6_9EURO|nr:hypothetical protein ASPZODRAFT_55785 [Penicilliopsis zonata CBS 506.65]OJJ50663.1 hypothetical protein ASPZODRAFT_55785 [Penicilliopsis zonata CBS 506.65]
MNFLHSAEHEHDNFGVDWVLHYEFEDIDSTLAVDEFRALIQQLEDAHLHTQVRPGNDTSLLVFIRIPRDRLGVMIHESRVKDWLHGITHSLPIADREPIDVTAETPSEELRSIYHAVTWQKQLGGAGITPGVGKWKHVTAAFPLHDPLANAELLRRWSRTTTLSSEDLDAIRALFGEKVAFYFAFIHCYSLFLLFPTVCGVVCWLYGGPYSILFGILNGIWCIVFVEYWKIRETELSLRWKVKGSGVLKVNRIQYTWEKEVIDSITGEIHKVFSTKKQLLRQLLLIPFVFVASLALGTLIVGTFALEVFISEVYNGPLKGYLEFLPTVLFSLSLPTISSTLTSMATRLTDYENYRTQDQYDLAQTQKTFVMNFITSFLPTLLTAFVYVPFGEKIVSILCPSWDVRVDATRLQQEVVYLSVTAQVLNCAEELLVPYLKRTLWQKYRAYRHRRAASARGRAHSRATDLLLLDPLEESSFLRRVRTQAASDEYNVHDDILEMCVQFGYLALFGVVWPLVPLGFLLNNWLELRGDFFKLSLECQRPPPIRAESIGPSLQGLEFLTWLGTLSTAAILHIYRSGGTGEVHLSSVVMTIFAAEQAYLAVTFGVRYALQKLGSQAEREEVARQYAVRKRYLASLLGGPKPASSPSARPRVRFHDKVDVYHLEGKDAATTVSLTAESERQSQFWTLNSVSTAEAGVKLIRALSTTDETPTKQYKSM